jgi:BirA family transcriptional regulator, biotin operon repressor / biotin---[acetyl-CoA-carboxylase] ligase
MVDDELAAAVAALPRHWQTHYFAAVDSTQQAARAASRLGALHRSIFVADYQRAGRGRQGRAWVAPPGVALMLSVVFRDTASPPVPWRWTSLASLALAAAIEEILPGLWPTIKWPNDVLLNDRKVAGILAETSWDGRQLLAVVGVGVNVRTKLAELAMVGGAATSLSVASGQDVDRGRLLHAFVRQMDDWLERPAAERYAAWQARLWGRGQRLRLADLGREEEVIVLGGEPDGSLRVRLSDGTERLTTTGELIM